MAQVSSGSFNTSACEGRYLTFNWSVDNTNTTSNYKEIYWSVVGAGAGGYVTSGNFKVVIDGETVYSSANRVDVWVGTVIASGYKKIYHNNDGTRSFSASVEAGIYEFAVNCRGSGSWELPTIAVKPNITSFSVFQRDETSVIYSFSVDVACDYAWYSVDNGANWYGLPNTNIVSGLSANTTYQFRLKVRRADNQYTAISSTYPQSTYNYPHCIESPDFTIGEPVTLKLYNPLNREVRITGYANSDNRDIFGGISTGTTITGFNDSASVNAQYASIPSSQSGGYRVVIGYDSVAMVRDSGNVYRIRGNESPTINAFDYIDSNSAVVAITGDNTQIVQNKSMLQARFHSATANYGAGGIQSYTLECNGISIGGYDAGAYDIGVINSARDVKLTLTAYDSRGLSASKTITVKMVAYEAPKASVTLERLNNYEDETYLTVDGSVSSVLSKNTMAIKYRYKQSGGSYGSFTNISDRVKQTLSLDKNNSFIFNIVVTDAFGEKFDAEFVLNKGTFPLFIDTEKNSVGINCFPKYEKSLEINGILPPMATSYDDIKTFDDVADKLERSGLYTVALNGDWYNLINIRHRNGEEDGQYYGMQIRSEMITFTGKLQVRNHQYNGWGKWRNLQEEGDTLFEGNANVTFTLNETVANFSSIEIFFSLRTSGVDYCSSMKVFSPQGKRCSLISLLPNSGYVIIGMGAILLEGSNVSFVANNTFIGADLVTPVTTNEVYILKVVGYR